MGLHKLTIGSEYDQNVPQSLTIDQLTAQRARAREHR